MRLGAELVGQRQVGAFARGRQANDQVQVGGIAGGLQDFRQLFVRIEAEGAHTVIGIGLRNGGAALDRVHEGQAGARQGRTDELDFVERRDVERAHAGAPQGFKHPRRRIGFDGVKDIALEVGLEPLGGNSDGSTAHEGDGAFRRLLADQVQGGSVCVHFGSPILKNV